MADLSSKTLSIVSSPGANEDHPKEVSFDNLETSSRDSFFPAKNVICPCLKHTHEIHKQEH